MARSPVHHDRRRAQVANQALRSCGRKPLRRPARAPCALLTRGVSGLARPRAGGIPHPGPGGRHRLGGGCSRKAGRVHRQPVSSNDPRGGRQSRRPRLRPLPVRRGRRRWRLRLRHRPRRPPVLSFRGARSAGPAGCDRGRAECSRRPGARGQRCLRMTAICTNCPVGPVQPDHKTRQNHPAGSGVSKQPDC